MEHLMGFATVPQPPTLAVKRIRHKASKEPRNQFLGRLGWTLLSIGRPTVYSPQRDSDQQFGGHLY